MKSRIRHSSLFMIGLAACMVLSGCRTESSERIGAGQASENIMAEETEALPQDRESYEAFLRGEAEALDGGVGKKVWQMLQQYTAWYLYCDVDGDDRQELCIRTGRYFCVIKNKASGLEILFEGNSFYYPIQTDDICGILYQEREDNGVSQKRENYRFGKLQENGETEELLTFSWHDMNDDREQNEDDQYLYDQREVSMQEWMEETEEYRNCRELEYENWEEIAIEDSEGKRAVFPGYAIYPTRITEAIEKIW